MNNDRQKIVYWMPCGQHKAIKPPAYQTIGAAGADLYATADFQLLPRARVLHMLGLAVAVPEGFELQIRPRSGIALKQCVTVLNSPGTIDSDYRDEVGVILINHSERRVDFKKDDRIAQAVLCPVYWASFVRVDALDVTTRPGGFGSTKI